ncbi:MAG: AMP-binding protein, partial [bacterium]|nr:AMP-binding protein [bacterium]
IPTLSTYILDKNLEHLPIGVPGEIVVGGCGVARGYLNQPELTAERFVKVSLQKEKKKEHGRHGIVRKAQKVSETKEPEKGNRTLQNENSPTDKSFWEYRTLFSKMVLAPGGSAQPRVAGPPEAQLYRSGDLGRLNADGEMEYLGRIDHQVQLRGYRIELGEIETQLLTYDDVKDAVVIFKQDHGEEGQLYAYVVTENGERSDLPLLPKEYLTKRLPQYMIPTYIIPLEKLPLTPNGKLDRAALPEPGLQETEEHIPPGNDIEKRLLKVWQETMQRERIGITENYFNIGGDSIKAIRLINAVNRELDTGLTILDLYQNDTIRQLAGQIEKERQAPEEDAIRKQIKEAAKEIEALKGLVFPGGKQPEEIEDIYPLSDIEAGMLYAGDMRTGEAVYHDQLTYQVSYENFEPVIFKQALDAMVAKHSILRTTFNMEEYSEPLQEVYKKIARDLRIYDISQKESTLQEEHIEAYLAEDRRQPFEITKPMWRMRIFTLGEGRLLMAMIFHHAILDGWSVASFSTELNNTYITMLARPDYRPQPLQAGYKDYIIEQRAWKRNSGTIEYWKKELDRYKRFDMEQLGKPLLEEHHKNKTAGEPGVRIIKYRQNLGETFKEQLEGTAKTLKTSVKHLCIAAYLYTLSMYTYDNEIVIGLVTNNRPLKEDADKILGCFLNSVPLRTKIPKETTWQDYFLQVEEKLLELKKHDRLPLPEIVRHIGEKTQGEGNPIFDILFNYVDFHIYRQVINSRSEDVGETGTGTAPGLEIVDHEATNVPLAFTVNMTAGQAQATVTYDTARISPAVVERIITWFKEVLDRIINQPGSRVRKDELLSEDEKQRLLVEFNGRRQENPGDKTIHEAFEEQAAKTPHAVAVVYKNRQTTYRNLSEASGRV